MTTDFNQNIVDIYLFGFGGYRIMTTDFNQNIVDIYLIFTDFNQNIVDIYLFGFGGYRIMTTDCRYLPVWLWGVSYYDH
jgi:hypothetical protein